MADTQDSANMGETGTDGTFLDEIKEAAEQDKKLLGILNQKFSDLQNYRQDAEIRSRLNMKYYKGKHWVGWNTDSKALVNLSYPKVAKPVTINLIRLGIRAHVSNIQKLSPQFRTVPMRQDYENDPSVLPTDSSTGQPILNDQAGQPLDSVVPGVDMEQSDNANRVLNLMFERFMGATASEFLLKNGLILGMGVNKSYWDIDAEKGLGGYKSENLSWWSFYYDSTCKDLVSFRDARILCHYVQRDVNYVKEAFGVDLTPDDKEQPDGGYMRDTKQKNQNADTVLLREMWVKEVSPYEMELDTGEFDEEGLPKITKVKHNRFVYKKYTFTSTKILDKQDNPLGEDDNGDGIHPFRAVPIEQCPDEIYAYGMVSDLRGINQEINERMTQIAAAAHLTSNPLICVVQGGGIEETSLSNILGRVHTVTDKGLAPFSVTFSGLGQDAYNSLNLLLKQFQDMCNLQDAALGRPPSGVSSGAQLQILLDANNAATGMWIEGYKEFLKEWAKLALNIMKNKFEAPRQFAFDSSKGVNVFTFDPRNLNVSDIKVSIENNIGGKAAFREEVERLMNTGAIAKPSGLKLLGYQDTEDLDRAMKEEQVFDAQMGLMSKQVQAEQQAQQQVASPAQAGMEQVQNNVANLQAGQVV